MQDQTRQTLFNMGSGPQRLFELLPDPAPFADWREIRVDINPDCRPDICSDLVDLRPVIADGAADLIYCSHVIEHFHDHEVDAVLREFARILRRDGMLMLRQPDLAAVVAHFDPADPTRPLYGSPAGPISALDVLYGHRSSIAQGNVFMAHRTGFTETSLASRLLEAGFDEVRTLPGPSVEFCAIASRGALSFDPQIEALIGWMMR